MWRWFPVLILAAWLLPWSAAQQAQQRTPPPNQPPPRSQAPPPGPGESSSKQDQVDLGPPAENSRAESEVMEMSPYDPHRAAKDVEIGDFYFKRQNYRAAISRYCEALVYKPNDAAATFHLAESLEKAGDLAGAIPYYQTYLKLLPKGPFADKAKESLDEIKSKPEQPSKHLAEGMGCGRVLKTADDQDRPTLRKKAEPARPAPTSPPGGSPR